jgi:hypothetical protein
MPDLPAEVPGHHFGRHRDAEAHLSLPELGTVLGAQILGEFGDDPHRFSNAKARNNYTGISPITRTSGTHNRRLADAMHQWEWTPLSQLTEESPQSVERASMISPRRSA